MLTSHLTAHINTFWEREILRPCTVIRIRTNRLFDPDWQAHGHMEQAAALVTAWMRRQQIGWYPASAADGDRTAAVAGLPGSIPVPC